MTNLTNIYIEKAKAGLTIEKAIEELNMEGLTIVESMAVLVKAFGISLAEAKQKISQHTVWSDVVKASEPLHDDLTEQFSANKN